MGPEDSTWALNRKTLREKRVSPHVRAVRPRRRRTRPGNAPGQVQHLKWSWARLHEKKVESPAKNAWPGADSNAAKKSGSKEKRRTSRTSATQPTGLREKRAEPKRFRREAKRETPRIVTERVTNERDKDRVRRRGRLVPKKAPAEFPRRAAHARILHS